MASPVPAALMALTLAMDSVLPHPRALSLDLDLEGSVKPTPMAPSTSGQRERLIRVRRRQKAEREVAAICTGDGVSIDQARWVHS